MVAFDVGANVGCHTLVMANAVGATGRVMAFEPNPAIFERLRANLCLNRFTQVETVPLCLSDRAGRQTLFAPLDDDYNQGLASVHRENLDRRSRAIEVRSVTLDDFVSTRALERLDLLKIDVEGHEFQVVRGARQVLQQLRPLLVLEFSERQWENAGVRPCQLEDYLGELGYSLFVLREHSITGLEHGVCQECNLLAIPQPLP